MIRNIRIDTLKLKNKNYKQANKVSIAQIKLNSKRSFERLIPDTSEYDEYISKDGFIQIIFISEWARNKLKIQSLSFQKISKNF